MHKQVNRSHPQTAATNDRSVAQLQGKTAKVVADKRPSNLVQKKQIEAITNQSVKKEPDFRQSPVSSPAIQLRAIDGMVTGITHLVKMKGKSIYRGNETRELEHGQEIVVDTDNRIRSRRGPNQEHFRIEDRERGTHIYRWFRVISVGGEPVAPGTFIREDAFTFHIPRERPERLHPNTAPSLDTHPGPHAVEHHRTPEARALDRLARGHWIPMLSHPDQGGIRQSEQPPHLAMTVLNGRVHAMGNTGERPVPRDWDAATRFTELTQGNMHLGKGDQVRKRTKLKNKLNAQAEGRYQPRGVTDPHTMHAISHAIAHPDSMHWGDSRDRRRMHGEMHLQQTIASGLHRRDLRLPRTRMQQQHVSGVMLDCMFCHWAHAIFNQVMGRHHGVEITTGGTHSGVPNEWQAPDWLYRDPRAWALFKQKLHTEGINAVAGDDGMVKLKKKASTKGMGLPNESDSDNEHIS